MMVIRIGPRMQALGLLSAVGILGAAVYAQWPEAKRYYKIETM